MARYYVKDNCWGKIANNLGVNDTTIILGEYYNLPDDTPYILTLTAIDDNNQIIKQERVKVTKKDGDELTVERGFGGDIPKEWNSGDYFYLTLNAGVVEAIYGEIDSVDSNAVHKSGNETISGVKTFNDDVYIQKNGGGLFLNNSNGNNRGKFVFSDGNGGFILLNDDNGNEKAKIRGYAIDGVQAYFTAGNVGIGTDKPTEKLDVSGDIKARNVKQRLTYWQTIYVAPAPTGDGSGRDANNRCTLDTALNQYKHISTNINLADGEYHITGHSYNIVSGTWSFFGNSSDYSKVKIIFDAYDDGTYNSFYGLNIYQAQVRMSYLTLENGAKVDDDKAYTSNRDRLPIRLGNFYSLYGGFLQLRGVIINQTCKYFISGDAGQCDINLLYLTHNHSDETISLIKGNGYRLYTTNINDVSAIVENNKDVIWMGSSDGKSTIFGELAIKSWHSAGLRIDADLDNYNENDNAYIILSQDGGATEVRMGFNQDTSGNNKFGFVAYGDSSTGFEFYTGANSDNKKKVLDLRNDGNIVLSELPTSDPGIAGALRNDNGTLKVSAG